VKAPYIILIVVLALVLRLWVSKRRRSGAAPQRGSSRPLGAGGAARATQALEGLLGDVGTIAMREVKERTRGRIFRVGTLLMLAAVGAAIIIPTLPSSSGPTPQSVGIVGGLPAGTAQAIRSAGTRNGDRVSIVPEPSLAVAEGALRSGKLDLAIVTGDRILVDKPPTSSSSPADAGLVDDVADYIGVERAYRSAGLTTAQAIRVDQAKPVPVQALQRASKGATKATSVIGLVVLFFMLTQYCTWILIGVMQEKSSRVVEVLLATVRPLQLLAGKVLGIGLVALGQATLVVGFALALGAAVGSGLLSGTAPLALGCELLWLILGYAFYCWVYAAAGSTAERQDQVQTLALPLSIPVLLGYIFSITVASTGNPDVFFKILAYLPPTAPFCMSVLVALGDVTWWQFVASVLVTMAATVAMARFAARIYRRAVLRTGGRVRFRELLAR
jgi:ABC-2 type transport system permease protein